MNVFTFPRCRDAIEEYLRLVRPKGKILLPAYIGMTDTDGSGVMDPIHKLGIKYRFYGLNNNLEIENDDLHNEIVTGDDSILLLINYFGFRDPSYDYYCGLAHENGMLVLEDQAHSFLSQPYSLSDASVYSPRKLLIEHDGILSLNQDDFSLFIDDKYSDIEVRRIENFNYLSKKIKYVSSVMHPMRELKPFDTPQSFPVIVLDGGRDDYCFELRQSGFRVNSLYYKLIPHITMEQYPDAHWVSGKILNLPIDQNMTKQDIDRMVDKIKEIGNV